jgi:hypothetical protein
MKCGLSAENRHETSFKLFQKMLVKFFTMRQSPASQAHNRFGKLSNSCRLKRFFNSEAVQPNLFGVRIFCRDSRGECECAVILAVCDGQPGGKSRFDFFNRDGAGGSRQGG